VEKISEKEKNILHTLIRDASKSFVDIGKELDLSRQAVAYNVSSLMKKGVIKRFTVDVDYNELGLRLPVIVLVKMRHLNFTSFREMIGVPALKESENVQDIFTLSGGYAFGILGFWKDNEGYGLWKTELIDQQPSSLTSWTMSCQRQILRSSWRSL
jgi:DNA-binding Lrp family transcriptional regulator